VCARETNDCEKREPLNRSLFQCQHLQAASECVRHHAGPQAVRRQGPLPSCEGNAAAATAAAVAVAVAADAVVVRAVDVQHGLRGKRGCFRPGGSTPRYCHMCCGGGGAGGRGLVVEQALQGAIPQVFGQCGDFEVVDAFGRAKARAEEPGGGNSTQAHAPVADAITSPKTRFQEVKIA